MSPLRRLWNVIRRSRLDDDLQQELDTHPRQNARSRLGNALSYRERALDAVIATWFEDAWKDVYFAMRQLRRTPGFTAVAVISLALCIGGNTAMFALVDRLVLRQLPVREPQRLAIVSSSNAIGSGLAPMWTAMMWKEMRQRAGAFDGAVAWSNNQARARMNLAPHGEVQPIDGMFVSGDFFTILGVPARLGRTFTSSDDVLGGGPGGAVAVISARLWQERFGGAPDVVGRVLTVERVPFTIIGVTPPEFHGPEIGRSFDVAMPIGTEPLVYRDNSWVAFDGPSFLTVMVRLPANQSLEWGTRILRAQQAEMSRAAPGYEREFQDDPLTLVTGERGTSRLRERYARPLGAVFVITTLVMLIACANIANLLLARRHELSVRSALGASRWRIARQLLVESLLLSGVGAAAGLLVAMWAGDGLLAHLSTSSSPVVLNLSADWRLLAFTATITIATGLLCGTVPALRAIRVVRMPTLKAQSRSSGDPSPRASTALVVAQVAVSLTILVGAGLFVGTFEQLAAVPLGFDAERVLVVEVRPPQLLPDPADQIVSYERIVGSVARVPGVTRAAGSFATPLSGQPGMEAPIRIAGQSPRGMRTGVHIVTPGFFATYGIPLRGRDFNTLDTATAPPVIVVNEAFIRRYFPAGEALGASVWPAMAPPGQEPPTLTIVGVVRDTVLLSLRDTIGPAMYQPLAQSESMVGEKISVSVRASLGSSVQLSRAVRTALMAFDPQLSFSLRPLDDYVDAAKSQERLVALLSAFFGTVAALLSALGLSGVTWFSVTQRTHEIGIRMAVGAQRREVLALFMGQALRMTEVGVALGLVAAAAVMRYLEGLLFGLTPLDPVTFVSASLVFAAVAALAAFVPAYRATGIDPVVALREE